MIVGWLAYDHWVYPHLLRRIIHAESIHTMTGFYLYALVDAMVRYFGPYALVLLVWGRTGTRRLGAALCALATGMYMWGLWVIFDKWIWGDNASAAQVSAYEWANLLVISAGLAVAWGIARRWGRLWMFGLLAAPILAGLTHELAIHSSWWRTHLLFDNQGSHDLTRQLVFIASRSDHRGALLADRSRLHATRSGPSARTGAGADGIGVSDPGRPSSRGDDEPAHRQVSALLARIRRTRRCRAGAAQPR